MRNWLVSASLMGFVAFFSSSAWAAPAAAASTQASQNQGAPVLNSQTKSEIKQSVKQNTIVQQGTGIMVVDPDTLVAAKTVGQASPLQGGALTPPNNTQLPRVASGLQPSQSQNLLTQLDANTGNLNSTSGNANPMVDPDVIAAEGAAQSLPATPSAPSSAPATP